MGCTYNFLNNEYTKEELVKLLQDKGIQNKIKTIKDNIKSNVESFEQMEEPLMDDELDDIIFSDEVQEPISKLKKLLDVKKGILSKLKQRVPAIEEAIKKQTTKEDVLAYNKLLNDVLERIITIEDEISYFSNKEQISLEELKIQAKDDLFKVEKLLSSGSVQDTQEATRLINFYKSMEIYLNKISNDNKDLDEHPFFLLEELYDKDGNIILPQVHIDTFNAIANAFKERESKLSIIQKNLLTEIVNSNPKVKQLYNELTYDQIMKALPDTNPIDMLIMDITRGIFSSNGVIPQVTMDLVQGVFAEEISKAKKFEEKHNNLLPKVQAVLKSLGEKVGFNVVSYNMFFQKDKYGNKTGRIVNRYSQNYFDSLRDEQANFSAKKSAIMAIENINDRNEAYKKLLKEREKWYKENTINLDITKIPELLDEFPEYKKYANEDNGDHIQKIKDNIGEKGYEELIKRQKTLIKKYNAWKDAYIETYLHEKGVENLSELTEDEYNYLASMVASKNPFISANSMNNNVKTKVGNEYVRNQFDYNTYIPRKYKGKLQKDTVVETTEETGFYDESFKRIESNSVLYEYYNLISEEWEKISNSFPEKQREALNTNSLAVFRKSLLEMMLDPNVSIFKKIWNVLIELYDRIAGGFGINVKDPISYENLDVITGTGENNIDTSFINNNKAEIDQNLNLKKSIIINKLREANIKINNIYNSTEIVIDVLPQSVINELAPGLRISANKEAFKKKFGKKIPMGKVLKSLAVHETVNDKSTDLPKIIKYLSLVSAEYRARQELLPFVEVLKQHYSEIKLADTNELGDNILNSFTKKMKNIGLRTNAITQFEDWFQRELLGKSVEKSFGVVKTKKLTPLEERKNIFEKMSAITSGRILTRKEKYFKDQYNKLIAKETDPVKKQELIDKREELGKRFASSAAMNNFMSYIRYLGLGFNVSSAITNFFEGQIGNMYVAAMGDYFEPHHYYRASRISKKSLLKSISGKYAPDDAKKLRVLMDRFDVLQDTSNELQKASINTPLNKLENVVNPMTTNKRTEYLNQSPLLIAIMLDTQITGKSGKKISVWDALDVNGKLKPDFRTEENISTWENNEGENFKIFKAKVSNAIITAHGNYANLRGMMAKSNVLGKMFMMFKTWVGMQLYTRFATQQDDIESGIKGFKGRYWSHTKGSGFIHGSLVGFAALGLAPGVLIGGGIGYLAAARFGVKSDISFLNELIFMGKSILRKTVAFPINSLAAKEVIKDYTNLDKLTGEDFNERDVKNMRALITEMSFGVSLLLLTFLGKAFLYDEDDEEDDARRIAHNLIINRLTQLLSSTNTYLNLSSLYDTMLKRQPLTDFFNNAKEAISLVDDYFAETDIESSGIYRGESKFLRYAQKLTIPGVFKSDFGFGSQMDRQYEKTQFDEYFWSDEKKERKIIEGKRAMLKNEIELELGEKGVPEEIIEKIARKRLNDKFPLPKKGEKIKRKTKKKQEEEETTEEE